MPSQEASSRPFLWHDSEFDDGNFQVRGAALFVVVVLLFSIILLVTVLFIYTRRVCRSSPPPPPPPVPLTSAVPDLAAVADVPIVLYKNLAGGGGTFREAECCICLGMFGDNEKVKVLPECRHCFHSECVDKWLKAQSSCPLCRASLGVDSLV